MKLLTAFSMAFGMFCAIPNPVKRWDESLRPLQLVCFPFVGAIIGGLWALAAWILQRLQFTGLLASALLTAIPLLLTGFIHLDGFMDCCDAIYSRRDLEMRQKILKDSQCGAFSVIHLAIYLLLFAASMERAQQIPWALLFIPVAVRCVSALSVATRAPLQTSQYAGKMQYHGGHIAAISITLVLSLCIPVLWLGIAGLCAAAAALTALLSANFGIRQLGGMSGDISGFAITRGELGGVLTLAVLHWVGGLL